MAKVKEALDPKTIEFIAAQPLFFVGTACDGPGGHVNLSPKGMRGTLHVADERTIAYLDYVGSGAETVAHLRQNGRIVLMFCAFEDPPRIVRVHGTGAAIAASTPAFESWLERFPDAPHDGVRAVILVTVARVSQSCGTGVPLMRYVGEREIIPRWAHNLGSQRLAAYRGRWNRTSIDGLPSFDETFVQSDPDSPSRPKPTER
ncbi:pyridoxamine 5'-phosphate oxidase family protein [Archangium lansingense]|uniref:Pyridoxamine 5'-phosphate oxidase family protein n=1 Tax=Archangium lansingense TaxID=2995310 RepID=A0ABT4A753_9BACT|nr:pyridoxamine 5'-phosphate oxidase family protein [Archangium lansinium]MCY1077074.1 pyridoxamine 5'-phosphate oxidase family protein [Archangium lansinium]